jgi:hypothetical protein
MNRDQITDLGTNRTELRRTLGVGLMVGTGAVVTGLLLAFGGPIAAAAVIAALVAVFVVFRDIEVGFWGVIAVVCLLPFATIPVDVGLTPTLLDLALGVTVGIWLFRMTTSSHRKMISSPITLPIALFLIVIVYSFIFGLANGPLTANLVRHIAELIISVGFVFVIVDYFSIWERIERIVKILLVAGSAAALIAVIIWLLPDFTANDVLNTLQRIGYPGGFVIRYIEENPELSERAIGTSVDPNALGGMLLLIGALATPQLVSKRPLFPRWVAGLMVGIIVIAIILTFSRGAMVGLLGAWGLIVVARYRRLIPYVLIIGALLLLLPMAQGYILRFVEGFAGQDLATQMRFGEYRDALALIARYPLFGVGFIGTPDIDLYLGVASVYLTIGQQMGVLGILAFLAVIITVFGYAFLKRSNVREDENRYPIWLGLHAALIGGLVTGIFDHYLFNIDFHHAVTIFWLFLGLAVASTRNSDLGDLVPKGQN